MYNFNPVVYKAGIKNFLLQTRRRSKHGNGQSRHYSYVKWPISKFH